MDIRVEYLDAVSPFIRDVIKEKPSWMRSALKSTGWWAQQEIKAGIRSGAPGGQRYADLTPPFLRRKLGWGKKPSSSPLGRLVNAVGYDSKQAGEGLVLVGWLSRSAVWRGSQQEKGFSVEITKKMRRKFSKIGSRLSAKGKITIPARPTFKPMKPIIEVEAPSYFQNKIMQYLLGASERSKASSKRKYRVYR